VLNLLRRQQRICKSYFGRHLIVCSNLIKYQTGYTFIAHPSNSISKIYLEFANR